MTARVDPFINATEEAAVWLARLHADDRSTADERAFRAWVDADPVNEMAFLQMTNSWELAGAVPRNPYQAERSRRPARREFIGAALSLGIIAAGVGYMGTARAEVYRTGMGEQRRVTLSDGTSLFLDTDSEVRVRYNSQRRFADVIRGRCHFKVVFDRDRPFLVDAADRHIEAPRAGFDVRLEPGSVEVFCESGDARVSRRGDPRVYVLRSGERIISSDRVAARIDVPDTAATTAWQSGQLVFDNSRLDEAVAEMNRYSATKLVLGEDAAKLRISGVYRTGDNAAFARSLTLLLPLSIVPDRQVIRISPVH